MDKHEFFERNLQALSLRHGDLCKRLRAAETTRGRYQFMDGGSNGPIPAWAGSAGTTRLLHSLVAPQREAEKLIAAGQHEGCIILFGLGAGFQTQAALAREEVQKLIVIDYDIDSIAELLSSREYTTLFQDTRFTLLVDSSPEEIERSITETYHPCLHHGIRTIPLRARCEADQKRFLTAADAVRRAIDSVSSDYSVQTRFGRRWFANIVRNLRHLETTRGIVPPLTKTAAVCAAGPSLDIQIERLKKQHGERFIIATDTALGTLLAAGITADAVVSIDCQHISYLHFMGEISSGNDRTTMLFLDLASPPLIAASTENRFFFSCGHPLVRYVSAFFKEIPALDDAGANVTYAAVSLAERLGAKHIELYGADFAYPYGMAYTRGAYFYPYFDRRQTRFYPVQAQLAEFLFKMPSLAKVRRLQTATGEQGYYYETRSLLRYRNKIEEKARLSSAAIEAVPGIGAPINLAREHGAARAAERTIPLFETGAARMHIEDFLRGYRRGIETLPHPGINIAEYVQKLSPAGRMIWTTLLPSFAAYTHKERNIEVAALFETVRAECLREIDSALAMPLR